MCNNLGSGCVWTYYNSNRYVLSPGRKSRLDVPGGFYHVLARGNHRTTIFHDDADSHAYSVRVPDLMNYADSSKETLLAVALIA